MIRYIFVVAIFISLASCCCYPNQFHAYVGYMSNYKYGNTAQHTSSAMQIWYDHCNNRARYDYPKYKLSYIYNYQMGEYVYMQNGTCRAYTLRGNLTKLCTPKGSHLINLGTYNFGAGKLPFHVSGYFRNYKTGSYGSIYSYSTDCVPLASGGYSKNKRGYSVWGSSWVNMTIGISNLGVFDKPKNCKGFTRGIVNQELDLMDVINRSFKKDVSTEKGEKFSNIIENVFSNI
ncbi:hypothetical protein TrispH2_003454 [Trichoplax sp. H2]|uniref:Uncharacterized protein n=1 Tax=Trichoplax adhaerens TaxID=10228 RepID=B3RN47_TRIAD|nr:predicted protein [Trichoplax adhaerens]EDV27391.1 predicted protein [Trichoplax adhaerens]RDD43916.1 hypothetical protein TrispH2_003454 [Trichoplax sp. H2]|eukprot:XP_002109225.1 predicted protein [Trichoplax adhaerens]